jgi:cathepsin L
MPASFGWRKGGSSSCSGSSHRTPAAQENGFTPLGTFQKSLGRRRLPKHVDWRGSPAELGVKDQAQCGSCWAFGATGAMQAAW